MITGKIYVRLQPQIAAADVKHYKIEDEKRSMELARAQKLFDLEQWLNGEIAVQAFEKFHVGLRVHVPEE